MVRVHRVFRVPGSVPAEFHNILDFVQDLTPPGQVPILEMGLQQKQHHLKAKVHHF